MTGETPEVRSDKREPKMAAAAMAAMGAAVAMAAIAAMHYAKVVMGRCQ